MSRNEEAIEEGTRTPQYFSRRNMKTAWERESHPSISSAVVPRVTSISGSLNVSRSARRTRVLEVTPELMEQVMLLNFTSAFFVAQAVLPGMVERRRGAIVNVSSVAARFGGGIGALAYSAAKAALSAMTKNMAREFAPSGIRVNTVSPGTIDTDYHRAFSTEQMLDRKRD